MTHIGAIETEYKGYRFRSRLEARWAVFFDAAEIEYEYEPQGFCAGEFRYLPDFYLPAMRTYVEVKGSADALALEEAKLKAILQGNSVLPHFAESLDGDGGLILLGEIPEPKHGVYFHPVLQGRAGVVWKYHGHFIPAWFATDRWTIFHYLHGVDRPQIAWTESGPVTTQTVFVPTLRGFKDIQNAYKAARQARFEHGQSGSASRTA